MKLCPSEADFRPVSGRVLHVSDYFLIGIEGCGYKGQTCFFVAYHGDNGWSGSSNNHGVYCGFFENLPVLPYLFSKTYPSFLTVKEGSTSHLGLLPSGKKRETALLGARNRYALRLADHQRSSPYCAGWDRWGKESL